MNRGAATTHPVDQASGLRRLFRQAPPEVLSVVPCGAGAIPWVARQVLGRGRTGRRVLTLDEWAACGNIADCLGVSPRFDLLQAVEGHVSFERCLLQVTPELYLAPVSRLVQVLGQDRITMQRTAERLRALQPMTDEWIVLAKPCELRGLSPLALAAPRVLLVLDPHPKAVTEAYATLKRLAPEADALSIGLALAGPVTPEARALLQNLLSVARRQLGVVLQLTGSFGEAFGMSSLASAREQSEVFIERLLRLSQAAAARARRGMVA